MDRLRVEFIQPEEEKTLVQPHYSLLVPKGGLEESQRGAFYKGM